VEVADEGVASITSWPWFLKTQRHRRGWRERRGISQEQLSHDAELHPVAISLIERGQQAVKIDTLRRLCIALRVQPGELLPPVPFSK
jgi:transcriptional regulator with XRE-family HTH domain